MSRKRDASGKFAKDNGSFSPIRNVGQRKEGDLTESEWADLVTNAMLSRKEFFRQFSDPRRNINDECGYPDTEGISVANLRDLYDREPVATRVVQVMPTESWKVNPTVFETEDVDQTTPFEEAWKALNQSLKGNSWLKDSDEGSPVWEYLRRADILSGIGRYGVLLIGLDDGLELREPIDGMLENMPEGSGRLVRERKLLYLRSFDESLATITQWEADVSNPRYGQPVEYSIQLNKPEEVINPSTGTAGLATLKVHWTRLIHVADNLGSSEVYGVPRLRPVFNRIYDLRKLYSGSAEMYWRGAFPGISLETDPDFGGDVTVYKDAIRTSMENYMNGLQRYMLLTGMTAKTLAPQVVDPTPQIDTQLEAICIELGIPKRIFTGSERGELASSQDDSTWNDRVRDRQNNYVTPRLIVPFVDRLIAVGVLPAPTEGYSAVWPDLDALTETEKALIAEKRTNAMAKYVAGNVESIIVPLDFFTRIIGVTEEEAEAISDAAEEHVEEMELEQDEKLKERMEDGLVRVFDPANPPINSDDEEGEE